MDDKVSYWLEIADYDLETAEAMLRTKRLLYVGFMCHQSIEKALKAALASQGKTPPFTHNLGRLAEARGVYEQMSEEQRDLLDNLEPLNIQSVALIGNPQMGQSIPLTWHQRVQLRQ